MIESDAPAQLYRRVAALVTPSHGTELSIDVVRATPTGGHFIGQDSEGGLTALLVVEGSQIGLSGGKLENLQIVTGRRWEVREGKEVATLDHVVAVRCTANDDRLRAAFVRVMSPLLAAHRPYVVKTIQLFIDNLVELFAGLALPSRQSTIGLWGELWVILNARDPNAAIGHWRVNPDEVYDFSWAGGFLEVKTTTGITRKHHVRLEQIRGPNQAGGFLASLRTRPLSGGVSIAELLSKLGKTSGVDSQAMLLVERRVATTLGSSWSQGSLETYDDALARDSFAVLPVASIPAPQSIPTEVSEVGYVVELNEVVAAHRDRLSSEFMARTLVPSIAWLAG